MNVEIIRLLFDFGLLVLIWLVQLVVYPSFLYYKKNNLLKWHGKYTLLIGYIVMPLMIGQLSLVVIQTIQNPIVYNILVLVLVLVVWLSTFLQFVPLHHKISSDEIEDGILSKLIHLNWLRTGLWTLIFCLGFTDFLLS